jgi:hypothetical protein
MFFSKIKNAVLHPSKILMYLIAKGRLNAVGDEAFLKLCFRLYTQKPLNLKSPRSFNEKIQWLKLFDRQPEYTQLVDKYKVLDYVARSIGEAYLIPLLGVWERAEEIDFSALPDQFVLKCNHISGSGIVICKDKSKLNIPSARAALNAGLEKNHYPSGREWPYKDIPPRIIAEQYMTDDGTELKDYKIFCFDGEPRLVEVDFNRFVGHKRNLYTPDWRYIDGSMAYPADPKVQNQKPQTLDSMLALARKLSASRPFVRTDFYSVGDRIYFGEMTFYPDSGFGYFKPESLGNMMGDWLKLPTPSKK